MRAKCEISPQKSKDAMWNCEQGRATVEICQPRHIGSAQSDWAYGEVGIRFSTKGDESGLEKGARVTF
jgi:hypothetical protein